MAGPAFRAAPVRVRAPATSANLGPGFDAFGLALGWYDDVVARVADTGLSVDVAGEGADDVRRDARNLVVRAMYAAFDRLGGRPRGLELVCANRIPHGRGLGSSAAAIVAGLMAARGLIAGGAEHLDDAGLLALATEIEGHPDNVAACLHGGFTVAWTGAAGPEVVRLDPLAGVVPVAFVPQTTASTAKVRRMLPEAVPHADAAANAGRAGLLVAALTARPDILHAATEDRLHQSYRAPAMPRTAKLVESLRDAGVAAVVSGAGPTVLALLADASAARGVAELAGKGWTAYTLSIDRSGAQVLPLGG
jgi:homoserine kinase